MDDDPHCFCYGLERDVAPAHDNAGRDAFVKQVQARRDGAAKAASEAESISRSQNCLWRLWGRLLRTLSFAQKDLQACVALAEETREPDRLADLMRQADDSVMQAMSHYSTEPVARKLEKPHPDVAARLGRAQATRVVDAGKSKYYHAALLNFRHAGECLKRAGLPCDWEQTVSQVRASHQRKRGFMEGFERLVEDADPNHEPSFLDGAKILRHLVKIGRAPPGLDATSLA